MIRKEPESDFELRRRQGGYLDVDRIVVDHLVPRLDLVQDLAGDVRCLPGFVHLGAGRRSHYVGPGLFGYHCITDQTARHQPGICRAACTRLCGRRGNNVGATRARPESQDRGEYDDRRNQNPESERRTYNSKNLWLLGKQSAPAHASGRPTVWMSAILPRAEYVDESRLSGGAYTLYPSELAKQRKWSSDRTCEYLRHRFHRPESSSCDSASSTRGSFRKKWSPGNIRSET